MTFQEKLTQMKDFVVKDIALADYERKELDIAETEMPGSCGFSGERTYLVKVLKGSA